MLAKKIAAAALSAALLFPGIAHAQGQDEVAALDGIIGAALDAAGSEETKALLEGALAQVTAPESKEMVRGMIEQLPPEQRDALLANFDVVWDQLTDAGKMLLSGYSEQIKAIDEYGPGSFEATLAMDVSNRQTLSVMDAAAAGDTGAQAALQDSNVSKVRNQASERSKVDDDASSRSKSDGKDKDNEATTSAKPSRSSSSSSSSKGTSSSTSSKAPSSGSSSSGGSGSSKEPSPGSSGSSGSSSGSSSSGDSSGSGGGSGGSGSSSSASSKAPSADSSSSSSSGPGSSSSGSGGGSAAPAAGGADDVISTSGSENTGSGSGSAQSSAVETTPSSPAGGSGSEEGAAPKDRQAPQPGKAGVVDSPEGKVIQTEDGKTVGIDTVQSPDDPLYQSLSEEDQQYVSTQRHRDTRAEYSRGVTQTNQDIDGLRDESGDGAFNRRGESMRTYEEQRDRVTEGVARDEENLQAANEWSEAAGHSGNVRDRGYVGGDVDGQISEMDKSRRYNPNNRRQSTAPETPPETTETAAPASTQPAEGGGNDNA